MNAREPASDSAAGDADTTITTLGNGVRVVVIRLPYLATVAVSVFVRSGSCHEDARLNGISHFLEHMAFKGTHTRDCQAINLDAERLGAEVNAHTDKDHTAFHMRGLARDAAAFVRMLGDIVRNSTFPAAEIEREREVLLQEYAEDEDDGMATAFKLFDKACYGEHPAGSPIAGSRANIRRFSRAELVEWVGQQYTGVNTIVGVIGDVDPRALAAAATAAFGDMPRGADNLIAPPAYLGGIRQKRLPGTGQAHAVVGFAIPALPGAHAPFVLAAAMLGEGMSSPLLDELRERRGLVYHADCWTDVRDAYGQFVIEASTRRERLREYLEASTCLLRDNGAAVDAIAFERAQNQIAVRILADRESPAQRLELAALDLYALGRVRSPRELLATFAAIDAAQVRQAFATMLEARPAVAIAGDIAPGEAERLARRVGLDQA